MARDGCCSTARPRGWGEVDHVTRTLKENNVRRRKVSFISTSRGVMEVHEEG